MPDTSKIKQSVKDFLEKVKALDEALPEELAVDALTMSEEVKDACEEIEKAEVKDEEANVLEITTDSCSKDEEEKLEAKVSDAVIRALRSYGIIKDSATKALDEVEAELEEKAEDEYGGEKTEDSMREFIRRIKPVVASVKDEKQRRKLSDEIAKVARLKSGANYNGVVNAVKSHAVDMETAKKSATTDYDLGMDIARRFNPHYSSGSNKEV